MTGDKADRATITFLGAAFVVPWLYIWQGLDFSDQGYLLTFYRNVLRQPQLVEDAGPIWLTALIGSVWDAIYGNVGVIGMRALWALCLSLGMLWAYRVVKRTSSPQLAAVTTLAASIFLSDRRETCFSYNTSSSVLWVAAALCLTLGLVDRRRGLLMAAGALLGALPLARFPNLLGLSLLATPGLAALAFPERRPGWLRETVTMLLGVGATGVGALALMLALGHAGPYVASIEGLFAPDANDSSYAMSSLLMTFLQDQGLALAAGLAVTLAALALARAFAKLSPRVADAAVLALAFLGVAGLAGPDELWRYVVPGTAYWVLGGVALGVGRCSFEQRLVAFLALAILVLAPLGSNNGITNAHVGSWLAIPFLLALVAKVDLARLRGQGFKLALLGCLVLAGEGVHRGLTYTYRDAPRPMLRTSVGAQQLRAQLTTEERARSVAEVLAALRRRVPRGSYMLAYEGAPMLNYLTDTRPYLDRAWLMGTETGPVVRKLAADAPARTGCLPVAVKTLRSTRTPHWPDTRKRLEISDRTRGVRAQIDAFLKTHRYKSKWSNGFFEILEPTSTEHARCR